MQDEQGAVKRERKDARRNLERVLEAAQKLFAERGQAVTMEEVARRAGVGVGTLYRRFQSKEQLYIIVRQSVCADTHRCLRDAAESEPDPISKLRMLVKTHYQHLEQSAALLDLPLDSQMGSQCAAHGDAEFYGILHHMLEGLIVEAQRAGMLGPGDPSIRAALCLELLSPRAYQNLRAIVGCGSEDIAEYVVSFMLIGLGASRSR
jgi:AcrR family transcriptional regulator